MSKDRRLHPRVIVRLRARILEQGLEEWDDVLLYDLSAGGAALHSSRRVPIQSELRLQFALPSERSLEDELVSVTCLVVRSASLGQPRRGAEFLTGLHFLDLQAQDFDRVRVYVWDLLQQATDD